MAGMSAAGRAWAASGAMALTGRAEGPPLVAPDGVVDRIVGLGAPLGLDSLALLGERAALAGLRRGGARSCGDSARLLATADGWIAVSLAREDDVAAVAAWLGLDEGPAGDPWPVVTVQVAGAGTSEVLERGMLLGLPIAAVPDRATPPDRNGSGGDGSPVRIDRVRSTGAVDGVPLVVDLSSLWAGPLCARLLGDAGARIVKVESVRRPDGARRGPAAFYALLHGGHESVALDLSTRRGAEDLRHLVAAADVVIEGSRPRALEQLGIDALDVVRSGASAWVSVTGHGRSPLGRDRVAFGDDAAAGGGLVADDGHGLCFVADAVADPLSGMAAAGAAVRALESGGGWLIDVSMTAVAAYVAEGGADQAWCEGDPEDALQPTAPQPQREAPMLGEHTDSVLGEFDLR